MACKTIRVRIRFIFLVSKNVLFVTVKETCKKVGNTLRKQVIYRKRIIFSFFIPKLYGFYTNKVTKYKLQKDLRKHKLKKIMFCFSSKIRAFRPVSKLQRLNVMRCIIV